MTPRFYPLQDIFGFEIFQSNSFEQLLINYANEKLQLQLNHHIFVVELEFYMIQGITFPKIDYASNQSVLDLLEDRTKGLLSLLDDEASDLAFSYRKFQPALSKPSPSSWSSIRHPSCRASLLSLSLSFPPSDAMSRLR